MVMMLMMTLRLNLRCFLVFFHNCFDLVSDKLFRVETLVLIVESEKERRENEWKE